MGGLPVLLGGLAVPLLGGQLWVLVGSHQALHGTDSSAAGSGYDLPAPAASVASKWGANSIDGQPTDRRYCPARKAEVPGAT